MRNLSVEIGRQTDSGADFEAVVMIGKLQARSLLDGAGGKAALPEPLQQQERYDDRDNADQRAGDDDREQHLSAAPALLRELIPGRKAHRDRLIVLRAQHD